MHTVGGGSDGAKGKDVEAGVEARTDAVSGVAIADRQGICSRRGRDPAKPRVDFKGRRLRPASIIRRRARRKSRHQPTLIPQIRLKGLDRTSLVETGKQEKLRKQDWT